MNTQTPISLIEYFKNIYEKIDDKWNVESSLKYFGTGKSNEGTAESKAIMRYYVLPDDKRFRRIFLNFNKDRNIESIAWFFDKNEFLYLAQLSGLFGLNKMQNIIYDETTEFTFIPTKNKSIKYVKTSISEWIKKREDGTMFFEKNNEIFNFSDNSKVSEVIFKM